MNDHLSRIPYLRWAKFESGKGEIPLTSSAVPPLDWTSLGYDPTELELCRYSPYGDPALLEAIAAPWGGDADGVLLASSTTHAHFCFAVSGLAPGDRILAESPGYTCLTDSLSCLKVEVIHYHRSFGNGYALPTDEILALVEKERPRMLLVTNLHNPSGIALSDEEGNFLADLCERYGIEVLSDEVYRPFLDPDPGPLSRRHPRIVSLWGLNKVYGLPLIRVGWGLAPPERVERARRIYDATTIHNSCLSDQVARFACGKLDVLARRGREIAAAGWRVMQPCLERVGFAVVPPAGGISCFPRVPGGGDRLRERLLEVGVGVTPGCFFGAQEHVRIGFGLEPEVLEDAAGRIEKVLLSRE